MTTWVRLTTARKRNIIQRMIAAGAIMMTWLAVAAEWQRDWARAEQGAALTEVVMQHAGGGGIAFLWEQQLLNEMPLDHAGEGRRGFWECSIEPAVSC